MSNAQTPQDIYDSIKVLNDAIKDKNIEIKDAESQNSELSKISEQLSEIKDSMKELKVKEKKSKESFRKANEKLYDSLASLKNTRVGAKERLVITMINNLKNDVETEIWDEAGGNRKRIQVDFDPKMKKA